MFSSFMSVDSSVIAVVVSAARLSCMTFAPTALPPTATVPATAIAITFTDIPVAVAVAVAAVAVIPEAVAVVAVAAVAVEAAAVTAAVFAVAVTAAKAAVCAALPANEAVAASEDLRKAKSMSGNGATPNSGIPFLFRFSTSCFISSLAL